MKLKIEKTNSKEQWTRFLKSFCFLVITLGTISFPLLYSVKLLIGDDPYSSVIHINTFYWGYRIKEIEEKPLFYLLTIVIISSVVGSLWMAFFLPRIRRSFILQVLIVPWISLVLTSPVWGLIWSIHRWPPGGFSDPDVMFLFYRHDALVGLDSGWISAIQSFPINVLSYLIFCSLLIICKRLFLNTETK